MFKSKDPEMMDLAVILFCECAEEDRDYYLIWNRVRPYEIGFDMSSYFRKMADCIKYKQFKNGTRH